MKKLILIFVILVAITSCSRPSENIDGIFEIRERMFLTQVNEIYLNARDYIGRTLKLEGFIFTGENPDGSPFYAVARYGPGGCCGNDGIVGFEIAWIREPDKTYPAENAWVEAVGVLRKVQRGPYEYLYLDLNELNALNVRGQDTVVQ